MRNGGCKAMPKPLTAKAFDDLTCSIGQRKRSELIWTAEAIGQYIGTSSDFVTGTLAHAEGSPILKIGRRYCAKRSELDRFFSTKPEQTL